MKRALLILLAAASVASAQTFITVTADTNRVIRTNFSLVRSQVSDLSGASFAISNITGLQTALYGKLATNGTLAISNITSLQASLDEKLSTNGSAGGLTNFPAMLLQTNSTDGSFPSFLLRTNGSASALTNFPASVLLTNSSESVFPAALLRTNSSLSAFPQSLLRTNGDGSGLTNLPNANLSNAIGVLPISNGGTGSTNQSSARTALGLGSAATNDASAFQPASTALTNLAAGDASGLTNLPNANLGTATGVLGIANGGSGATNSAAARTNFGLVWEGLTNTDAEGFRTALLLGSAATNDAAAFQPYSTNLDALANNNGGSLTNVSVDLTAVLPSYSNNVGKVLAVATGGTNVEWTAISNTVTDASTLTNFPASILQTNSAETNFPAFLLRTNGSAAGLSGLSFALSNASDVSISNIASPIIRAWLNDTNSLDTLQIPGNTTTNQNNQQTTTIGIGAVSRSTLGTAVGFEADSGLGSYNVAIGAGAVIGDAANAVQIGVGTNTNNTTAQILSWGSVDSTEWGALANSTGIGREIMQAPTNGTNGQVLVWTNNDVAWATGGGGGSGTITSVAMTVPAFLSVSGSPITNSGTLAVSYSGTALPVANGGTGTTNSGDQTHINLGLASAAQYWVRLGYLSTVVNTGVAIGYNADARSSSTIALGAYADATNTYSISIGYQSTSKATSVSVGYLANSSGTNAVQLGSGTNTNASTIQFLNAGSVNSTEWGYLVNASTAGGSRMTNTNGVTVTNTIIGYDGTNYTTNTITVIDGIITSWTQ